MPQQSTARTALRSITLLALAASLSTFAPAQSLSAPQAAPGTTPPMNGIAHIAIRVQDIAASVAFYHKLGFDQAFANTSSAGAVTQSFVKLNDRQYIELYPVGGRDTQGGFMHLCFEGADLNALHDFYVSEGQTPISVRTAAAGNLLFTMKGPDQPVGTQNIEYTQYMPGSKHTLEFGKLNGPDRVGEKMTVVVLAMQDPAAARTFYLDKMGFAPSRKDSSRLDLPGTSGEQVQIVPAAALGFKSSIILETANLDKAAAQLTRQGVAFTRAGSDFTDASGKKLHTEMLSVTDPDGNIIRIQSN